MSVFPAIEADELVTRQFLREELAEALHRKTVTLVSCLVGAIAASTALLAAVAAFS